MTYNDLLREFSSLHFRCPETLIVSYLKEQNVYRPPDFPHIWTNEGMPCPGCGDGPWTTGWEKGGLPGVCKNIWSILTEAQILWGIVTAGRLLCGKDLPR